MPNSTHRIVRQVLELDFGSTESYIDLQQQATQVLRNQGMAAMEAIFNQLVGPHQQVRLERLEIDLGTLSGPNWPEQFTHQLAKQLELGLEEALRASTSPTSAQTTPPEISLFQQLLFVCQQGRLPWWGRKPGPQWLDTLQTTMSLSQWHQLADLLQRDNRALRRLVYTASDDFLQTLLERLVAVPEAARVQRLLTPAHWPAAAHNQWREQFWTTVLGHFTANTQESAHRSGSALMQQLLAAHQRLYLAYPPPREGEAAARPSGEARSTTIPKLPSPWQTWVDQASPSLRLESVANPDFRQNTSTAQDNSLNPSLPQPPAAAMEERTAQNHLNRPADPPAAASLQPANPLPQGANDSRQGSAPRDLQSPSDPYYPVSPVTELQTQPGQEAIYIEGAGLVILHPFLPELFRSLDLLSDRQFRHPQAQRRAVALLSYLTFGDLVIPDYTLLLPKLLAAWAWVEPLPPYDLTEEDRLACDELLAAVLRHWSALRSSSADWLRDAFFWRDGRLTPVDQGWQLTIERRAQDVLLSHLPWGIGVIHLPWMADQLYVNWIS